MVASGTFGSGTESDNILINFSEKEGSELKKVMRQCSLKRVRNSNIDGKETQSQKIKKNCYQENRSEPSILGLILRII